MSISKIIKIIFAVLIGSGLLVFILEKTLSCHKSNKKDREVNIAIFSSPDSVKWQIAYQTCGKLIQNKYCPINLDVDPSEIQYLRNETIKRNFMAILARYREYDRECSHIKDEEKLKLVLKDLFFKVYRMPGSIMEGKIEIAAFEIFDKNPTAFLLPNETYEMAVKRCEEILKKQNQPTVGPRL